MDSGESSLIETEQKYDVDADFAFPDLAALSPGVAAAQPQTQQLAATYYDTDDLRLAGAHITLRRRTGGSDAGWHIKLPVSTDTRRELHFPLGRATGTVPPRIAALVAEWTQGKLLRPIARLDTSRTVRRLLDETGQVLAEVADDRVTGSRPGPDTAGRPDTAGWRESAAWREVEVELVSGTRDLLDAAGKRLRAAGAQPSASASKLSRLLAAGPPAAGSGSDSG
jgi:inorganic triphosphatase YgiF